MATIDKSALEKALLENLINISKEVEELVDQLRDVQKEILPLETQIAERNEATRLLQERRNGLVIKQGRISGKLLETQASMLRTWIEFATMEEN